MGGHDAGRGHAYDCAVFVRSAVGFLTILMNAAGRRPKIAVRSRYNVLREPRLAFYLELAGYVAPILIWPSSPTPRSANHSLPPGPVVMPIGNALGLLSGRGITYSLIAPCLRFVSES